MNITQNMKTLAVVVGVSLTAGSANAATLIAGFQSTIGSEQATGATSEGGPFNVSVNANNAGYAGIFYDLPGTGTNGPAFERDFSDPVLDYSFVGGGTANVLTVSRTGGGGLISYTTTDTVFDGFGQSQLQLWTTSDPGADLTSPLTARDSSGSGYRSFGQAVGTVDITGLASGTVNVFYGAFGTTPTLTAVMSDSNGILSDITMSDAHLNGDNANRGEYYAAELDFDNDLGYDTIEFTWLANGIDDTANGRGLGAVLTGVAIPEPSSTALLGLGGLALILRRRK